MKKVKIIENDNSFLSDEFIKELDKIKNKKTNNIKQEEDEEQVNDESLDMVHILTKTKKKIVLKKKQYHFSSNNDVLQLRGKTKFETKIMPEEIFDKEENKDNIKTLDNKKESEKIKKPQPHKNIKAYSKKIFFK